MSRSTPVYSAGQAAGRAGRPHTDNPHPPKSFEELLWFHAWHVAVVENELGEKILPGLPLAESGLLMFTQKRAKEQKKKDREL